MEDDTNYIDRDCKSKYSFGIRTQSAIGSLNESKEAALNNITEKDTNATTHKETDIFIGARASTIDTRPLYFDIDTLGRKRIDAINKIREQLKIVEEVDGHLKDAATKMLLIISGCYTPKK